MKHWTKRCLALLLAVLMLVSLGAAQLAQAGVSVGKVKSLKASSVTATQIQLKWTAVKGVSGYCVYIYDEDDDEWLVETYTKNTAYTDKGLSSGTRYMYLVKAYIKDGTTRTFGKESPQVTVLTKPARVAKLKIKQVTPAKFKLSWESAQGATGYQIFARSADGAYKKIATTKKRTYTVKYPAAPGVMYFKLRPYAKSGKLTQYADQYSASAKANGVPAQVTSLTATNIGAASATLKWAACPGASEYIVFKKDVTTKDAFVKAATVKETTYEIKYPASPRTVHYSVQASATVNGKTTLAPVSEAVYISLWPKAVTSLTVQKAGHNSLTLAWNKADGASEYHVFQYIDGELQEIGTTGNTTYVVSNLMPETSYSFRVRAVANYQGQITETAISPVLTAQTTFGTVKGATVVLNTSNTGMLSWNALEGAAGYQIEKKNGDRWDPLGDSKTTVFSISDKEPGGTFAVGQTYQYRLRAYLTENGETVYSPYTDVIEVHSIPAKPEKPIIAAGADHTIVVDWPTVPGADSYHLQFLDKGSWVDYDVMQVIHKYVHNGVERTSFRFPMEGDKDTGTHQYRVAAAVKNDGRWTYGAYSEPASMKYTYEPEPETVYSDAMQQTGLVGYLYDPNEGVFFTADDPWQRNFGFNKLYDLASQFVWIQYDTTRFYFSYQDSDWMIQPWKGQYGAILFGAELGVYKKYTDRDAEHYDCAQDDDRLLMSMELERNILDENGKMTDNWQHEFNRPYGTYWWCTGFKLGYLRITKPFEAITANEGLTNPTYPDLRANFRVTVKDYEMMYAFTESLEKSGYKKIAYKDGVKPLNLEYAVHDLDVYFPF